MSHEPPSRLAINPMHHSITQSDPIREPLDSDDAAWGMYVRGNTPGQIGQAMNRPAGWGRLTIHRLLEQHENAHEPLLRGHLAKLLEEVNLIRQAGWLGWDRSLKDKVRHVEKTKEPAGRGGNELTKTTESRSGDLAALRVLIECSKRESALRGIERPTTIPVQRRPQPLNLGALIQQMETTIAEDRRRQHALAGTQSRESNQEKHT